MISEQEMRSAYEKAPQAVKDALNSDEVFRAFHDIRKKHSLHIDHAGNLANAINAVVLGVVPFTDMGRLLDEGMQGVSAETKQGVLKDLNEKIFLPLREKALVGAKERAETVHTPPPVSAPTPRPVSVIEQKLPTQVVTPAVQKASVPETPKAQYRSHDPYREVPE